MSTAWALVRLARPHHWVKNAFVLAPVPFALSDQQGALDLRQFGLGLAGFCLVNSAVYAWNDVCDAVADRDNPRTATRPIARGDATPRAATALALVLVALGALLVALTRRPEAWTVVAIYAAVNLAYSGGAKRLPLIDVFLLASGFVLRVLLGCALIAAPASAWLLLCTGALALLLGFGKRRADRSPHYVPAFLSQAMTVCAATAMLAYALYCIESDKLTPGRELASMPFVAYAILEYLRLCEVGTHGGSPVELAYKSPAHQLCALGWLGAVFWGLPAR